MDNPVLPRGPVAASRALPRGLFWALAAVVAGIGAGTLPGADSAAIALVVIILICTAITPLAGLTALIILSPLRALLFTEASTSAFDIGQLGLAFVLFAWLTHRLAWRRTLLNWRWSPVLGAVAVFLVATAFSLFSAQSAGAWLNEWLKWVELLLLVVLCLDVAADRRWEWLIFALCCAGLANAVVGLYQFFGGSGALHLLVEGRFFRAFGTFGQPNPFGAFMGMLAPLAVGAAIGYAIRGWRQHRNGLPRWPVSSLIALFYIATAAVLTAGLIASWSRGAWLGLVAAAFAFCFALPRRLWGSLVILLGAGVLAVVVLQSGLLPGAIYTRLESAFTEAFSASDVRGVDITTDTYAIIERLAHWQAAVSMAESSPWTGVGFGNYENAYAGVRLANWKFPLGHAHNYYLNVLAEAGMIGLLGYGLMWAILVWITWRARRHPDSLARFVMTGLFAAWAYMAVHSLTDNLYVNNLFLQLGLLFGLAAVVHWQLNQRVRRAV